MIVCSVTDCNFSGVAFLYFRTMKSLACFIFVFFSLPCPVEAQIGAPFTSAAERNGFFLGELNEEQVQAYKRLDTTNAECLLIWGIYDYTNRSYANAMRNFDQSIRIFPLAETYFYRANCKRILQDFPGEASDNEHAIALDSSYREHIRYMYQMEYMQAAEVAAYRDDLPKAIAEYTRAIDINPHHGETFYRRGLIREYTGDSVGAQQDFLEAIRLDVKMSSLLEDHRVDQMYSVVYAHLADEDLPMALAQCELILARNPSGRAYYLKGTLLDKVSDSTGAEAAFQKSIELDSAYCDLLRRFRVEKLSESAKEANGYFELEQAVSDYTKALAIDSSYSWLWYGRGQVKERMNNPKGAMSDYKQAHTLDSLNADVLFSIGSLEMKNGNYPEAIAAYDKTTAYGVYFYFCPFYRVYELRAKAKELNKDYLGAVEDYTTLIGYDGTDYAVFVLRGHLYVELNMLREACSDFEWANELWKGAAVEEFHKYCE